MIGETGILKMVKTLFEKMKEECVCVCLLVCVCTCVCMCMLMFECDVRM